MSSDNLIIADSAAVSSSDLQIPQYKSNSPMMLIGVALIVLAALGFIYSLIPPSTKTSEVDVGTKLQILSPRAHVRELSTESDTAFRFANWVQRPSPEIVRPQKYDCSIDGFPRTVTEGLSTIKVSYFCNGQIIETPKVRWTTNAGKLTP